MHADMTTTDLDDRKKKHLNDGHKEFGSFRI